MKVVPLDSHAEPMFWEYVLRDVPHYYFFILDMKRDRQSTRVFLALNHTIEGMLLIYKEKIAQLRGTAEAAKALLEIDMKEIEIQGQEEHKFLILEKFKVKKALDLVLMTLKKGEETPRIRHHVERLSLADAPHIAALMRNGDPEWWGEITAKEIEDKMDQRLWLGIRDEELVSIGGCAPEPWGSNITTVVTDEAHRNKGYATSIVSALTGELFRMCNLALIHVESTNVPALKAYKKVGFNPLETYFLARTY